MSAKRPIRFSMSSDDSADESDENQDPSSSPPLKRHHAEAPAAHQEAPAHHLSLSDPDAAKHLVSSQLTAPESSPMGSSVQAPPCDGSGFCAGCCVDELKVALGAPLPAPEAWRTAAGEMVLVSSSATEEAQAKQDHAEGTDFAALADSLADSIDAAQQAVSPTADDINSAPPVVPSTPLARHLSLLSAPGPSTEQPMADIDEVECELATDGDSDAEDQSSSSEPDAFAVSSQLMTYQTREHEGPSAVESTEIPEPTIESPTFLAPYVANESTAAVPQPTTAEEELLTPEKGNGSAFSPDSKQGVRTNHCSVSCHPQRTPALVTYMLYSYGTIRNSHRLTYVCGHQMLLRDQRRRELECGEY